jgi:hypothetical protein
MSEDSALSLGALLCGLGSVAASLDELAVSFSFCIVGLLICGFGGNGLINSGWIGLGSITAAVDKQGVLALIFDGGRLLTLIGLAVFLKPGLKGTKRYAKALGNTKAIPMENLHVLKDGGLFQVVDCRAAGRVRD